MYRFILASVAYTDVFNINSTDTSYYDNFLNAKDLKYMQDSKNRTGVVVNMTPTEYYQACADDIFGKPVESIKRQRASNAEAIQEYTDAMLSGDKFPLCFINYADKAQEGLHRMMAAGNAFGWDEKFPVLVVTAYDEEREIWRNNFDAFRNYLNYEFKSDVEEAASSISGEQMPTDFYEEFRDAIKEQALTHGYNIEVDFDTDTNAEGYHRVYVWVTSFNGLEGERNSFEQQFVWLEDMYEAGNGIDDFHEDTFNIDDYLMDNMSEDDVF